LPDLRAAPDHIGNATRLLWMLQRFNRAGSGCLASVRCVGRRLLYFPVRCFAIRAC